MQAALDVTVPYVHERKQFGQSIGEFQVMIILNIFLKPFSLIIFYNSLFKVNLLTCTLN
jgi:hypothetical protein